VDDDDGSDSDIELLEVVAAPVKEFEEDPDCFEISPHHLKSWPEQATKLAKPNELIKQKDFPVVFDAVAEWAGGLDMLESAEVREIHVYGNTKKCRLPGEQKNSPSGFLNSQNVIHIP
jgi:hypothetical protein